MLYWLLYEKLYLFFHPFRLFRFLTFRTAFASMTALLIGLFIGPWVIQKLREFQIGQYIREEGPKDHQKKAGTPTMGGVLICIAILLPTLLWADLGNVYVVSCLLVMLGFGLIGFYDDYLKVTKQTTAGFSGRMRLLAEFVIAAVASATSSACSLVDCAQRRGRNPRIAFGDRADEFLKAARR